MSQRSIKMRPIEWRLSAQTFRDFTKLFDELMQVEGDSDEAYTIEDQIRSLPGFPHDNDPDRDLIEFTITSIH